MCGIVGYSGSREAGPLLVQGLSRLEYRGYDSAGLAIQNGNGLVIRKVVGSVAGLADDLRRQPAVGTSGIGHTRWATHGAPSVRNAHPLVDNSGRFAVVHNGIIENAGELRTLLEREGCAFTGETDSEVIVHLIAAGEGSLEERVLRTLERLEGTYGLAVISALEPGRCVVARRGSPLLLGITDEGETFAASDPSAIIGHTRRVVYLQDGDVAVLEGSGHHIVDGEGRSLHRVPDWIDWELNHIKREGFPHFMLKEIVRQPSTIRDTLRGRLLEDGLQARLDGLNLPASTLSRLRRVVILGCGTSWHAGLVGRHIIEEMARLPVQVEYASEFRYQNGFPLDDTLVVAISQSGETADTLEAMRASRAMGARVVAVVNVVGSTIAREADGGVYLHAGPEISVASTKAFTSQIVALSLLALYLGQARTVSSDRAALVHELQRLPSKVEAALETHAQVREIAERFVDSRNVLYLGRGISFPVALEGALKLKEISYIHAEGYPAAEMKHGPIALIEEGMPVVVVAPRDRLYPKTISNMEEAKARGASVIVITTAADRRVREVSDHVLVVPQSERLLSPVLAVIPLQILAYETAVRRGCNVDRPRNLAKSVTVE